MSESPYVYLFAIIGLYLDSVCIMFGLSAMVVFEGPANIKIPAPV